MYVVRIRIGEFRTVTESRVEFSKLYRAGRTLVKCGKRNGFRVGFSVVDAETGKTIVRLYSLQSKSDGKWVAAQSAIGKYNTHIDF